MANYVKPSERRNYLPVTIFVVLAVVIIIMVVSVVMRGAGSTQSKASRSSFLTPSDDPLSLEQDLKALGNDTTVSDEQSLDSLR